MTKAQKGLCVMRGCRTKFEITIILGEISESNLALTFCPIHAQEFFILIANNEDMQKFYKHLTESN